MRCYFLFLFVVLVFFSHPAQADFIVSSAIIEFNKDGVTQQDIELVSKSKENDYIVSEISEIVNPGLLTESRKLIDDPSKGGLLVTPDKAILSAGGRKVIRFVLLDKPTDSERIYRVAIKPVIKGVNNNAKLGLKILIGYEVLVIVRPEHITPNYTAVRTGKEITITNSGNSNVLFENGKQCIDTNCQMPPVARVYPGQKIILQLPFDAPVSYSVWNGIEAFDKKY